MTEELHKYTCPATATRVAVRYGAVLISGLILSSLIPACALPRQQELKEYYEVRAYFKTTVSIRCFYDPKSDFSKVAKQCWEKAELIQENMNAHAKPPHGDLARLNESGIEGVRVHGDVYRVLKHSVEYSRLTQGAYDVTVFPLVELWRNAQRLGRVPDSEELRQAKDKVGYQNLGLQDPDLVFFKKPGMKVDLGSPASGYFCDQMAGILDANGIKNFLVDGGGEIFCRGMNKGRVPWRIGIQDPFDKTKIFQVIELKDQGLSTSGNYEKFYTIGQERFSHIIDPRTGYPQKDAVSATVIAPTAEMANELSTALCVLGSSKGLEVIRSLRNVGALIIELKNGKTLVSGTEKMLKMK